MNPPARTSVILVPQRGHGCPPCRGPPGSRGPAARRSAAPLQDPDRLRKGRARGLVEGVHLFGARLERLRKGRSRAACRISSLYALPIPATNAWLRSRFLSSPGWRRIRSRQTSSVRAGSSASGPCRLRRGPGRVGPRRRAADRPCPSGWGRGNESRPPSSAGSQRRRASTPPRPRGPSVAGAEPEGRPLSWSAALCPARRAGTVRSASGSGDRVALEIDQEELAAAPDRLTR